MPKTFEVEFGTFTLDTNAAVLQMSSKQSLIICNTFGDI